MGVIGLSAHKIYSYIWMKFNRNQSSMQYFLPETLPDPCPHYYFEFQYSLIVSGENIIFCH